MTDSLSIFAAAREAPFALALRMADRTYTFAELAEMTAGRLRGLESHPRDGTPYSLVAGNSLETAVTLYALIEGGVPALLLHPKLTETERVARLTAARRAGPVPHPGALAVLYTSGTTGNPRGAVLTRAALKASADTSATNLGWQPGDCWLACMPLAHVGGLSILTRCLAARQCVALEPGFDVERLPGWIETRRITLLSLVPTMLRRLLDEHSGWMAPSHLRCVLLGGAAASPALLAEAARRRVPLVVTYGLTEACSQVTATRYQDRFTPPRHHVGAPLAGVELRVVEGRIQVKGAARMAGYLGHPPLREDDWLDTGDLGEIVDGALQIHARRTDLIVTGGENVHPVEIEGVLESFPGIAAAAVFGAPDEVWGQVVAAALVADGATLVYEKLQEYLAARLASFKRPRRICLVLSLPMTATGKLDRSALGKLAVALRPLAKPPAAHSK